jgi:sulfate adenylyltransferase large subunit/phosphoadenylyl-sulfate reductase (thioredoxin)
MRSNGCARPVTCKQRPLSESTRMNIAVTDQTVAPSRQGGGRPLIRVVTVGHVDHGKSTLIGRLLHETGSLPDGKLEALKAVSDRRGMKFEWSFVLDALQTERDRGITLDTSQVSFRTPARDVVLIDAPGHAELLRNMITGAAQADAALLIVDATEGIRGQTRRHAYLLHLLGLRQVAVLINKMDRVEFDEGRYREIEAEIARHLCGVGLAATAVIPISARHGDGVARRSASLAWYGGPTVLEVLDRFSVQKPAGDLPLRLPVQAIYAFDDRRIVAGRIESGRVTVGDEVVIAPRGTLARVRSIEAWPAPREALAPRSAEAGESVGLILDQPVLLDRGDVIAAPLAPCRVVRSLRARVFWLHDEPLSPGASVTVRIGMAECRAEIGAVANVVDPGELAAHGWTAIARNNVGDVEIALAKPIAVDLHAANPRTGRLVLDVGGRIAGGGLVLALDGDEEPRGGGGGGGGGRPPVGPENIGAEDLGDVLRGLAPAERIARLRHGVEGKIVFTTSFGPEDQVILHLIAGEGGDLDIDIVTLDTGRLFRETDDLWAETERRYGRRIRAVYPEGDDLEAFVGHHGINGFYESREARTACCHVRKVAPLARALDGAAAWIVGLRADQSANRQGTDVLTRDERGLIKMSPLFDWTREAVHAFAAAHGVPLNPLHAKGFVSIGCAPCTRAIAPGEPERAGRWWWETDDKKECGLHGRLAGREQSMPR